MPVKVVPIKVKESNSLERDLSLWGKKVDSLKDSLPIGGEKVDTFEKCLPIEEEELDPLEELSLHSIFFKYFLVYTRNAALVLCGVSKEL